MADDSSAVGVSQLDKTYPVGAVNSMDVVDNQLRMLKQIWLTHFPNFTTSPVTADEAELNKLDGVTSSTAELNLLTGRSLASTDDVIDNFPAGTLMLFQQTTAPTGWVKQTTHNDKALRVVSGTAGSGGSLTFSGVFGRTASDSEASHTHGLTHTHTSGTLSGRVTGGSNGGGLTGGNHAVEINGGSTGASSSSSTGVGSAHSHGMDMRVLYADVIIAKKS